MSSCDAQSRRHATRPRRVPLFPGIRRRRWLLGTHRRRSEVEPTMLALIGWPAPPRPGESPSAPRTTEGPKIVRSHKAPHPTRARDEEEHEEDERGHAEAPRLRGGTEEHHEDDEAPRINEGESHTEAAQAIVRSRRLGPRLRVGIFHHPPPINNIPRKCGGWHAYVLVSMSSCLGGSRGHAYEYVSHLPIAVRLIRCLPILIPFIPACLSG